MPGLDFLASVAGLKSLVVRVTASCKAALCSCCGGAGSGAAAANQGKAAGPSGDSKIKASHKGRRASQRVTLANANEDKDGLPSASGSVDNPMRASVGGDVEMGSRGSVADHIPAPSAPAAAAPSPAISIPISLSSRLLYALFGKKAVKAWRKDKCQKAEKTDPKYKGEDFWQQTPYLFLYLQVASAFASFVVAAVNVDRSLPAWDQYTNFYALVVNSGIPTAVFSMLKMALIDGREQMKFVLPEVPGIFPEGHIQRRLSKYWPWWLQPFLIFPIVVLVPPFCTHILPMIIYGWILHPLYYLYLTATQGASCHYVSFTDASIVSRKTRPLKPFLKSMSVRKPFAQYFIDLCVELSWRIIFVFMFHTLFNYGSLLYQQSFPITPEAYIGVLVRDWHLRSQTQCFLSRATNSADGIVILFSWF